MTEHVEKPPKHFSVSDLEDSDNQLSLDETDCFLCTNARTAAICQRCFRKRQMDSMDNLIFNRTNCWLCTNTRSVFICHWCLRKGDFVLSGKAGQKSAVDQKADLKGLRYIDRKMHLIKIEAAKLDVLTAVGETLDSFHKKLKLVEAIDLKKKQLTEIKNKIAAGQTSVQQMIKDINACRLCNLNHAKRIKKMRAVTEESIKTIDKYSAGIRRKQQELERLMDLRKAVLAKQVDVLRDIFPTEEVEPHRSEYDDLSPVTAALVEASSTSYFGGRWIDSSGTHIHHQRMLKIVQSRIPLSVSESLFQVLETDVAAASLSSSVDPFEITNCIIPGLAYSAQVTNLLAYFLNIRLPKKVSYRSFLGDDNPEKLRRSFCRLTFNLLYLTSHLKLSRQALETPYNPVKLLSAVFDSDFQTVGSPAVLCDASLVYTIVDDEDDEEKDDDNDMFAANDWESVTAALPSVVPPTPGSIHVAASFVSSAAAGVASLWRGFAGK